MRKVIGLGFAVFFLSTAACTGSVFAGADAGDDAGNVVPPDHGGNSDAGTDADGAAPPPGCDATKLPTDDVCVVDDSIGVFVSASLGSSAGDGTKAHPLASLDSAIAAAKKANKRVYACAETYAEQVHFQDGVSVFGYFTCSAGWAVNATHAKVSAPASPAAAATNVTSPTRVEAVDVFAPDFTTGSQSSIGLLATGSPGLDIVNATIHAGTGGKGADGANGIQLTDSGNAKNGTDAQQAHACGGILCAPNYGAAGGTNVCSGASGHDPAPGGSGGSGGEYTWSGSAWTNPISPTTGGNPTTASAASAAGGVIMGVGGYGLPGSNGADGAPGAAVGVFSSSGYSAAGGAAGGDGQPGQSGGGAGGANPNWTTATGTSNGQYGWGEGGAGGGAGGCPGLAAETGKGGGASVAVIAVQSAFVLDHVTLETSAGGAGGASGLPSSPTAGGVGGSKAYVTKSGGTGGDGGKAGVSGNGAGGPSIAVAYQGTKPQMLASTTVVGLGGSGVAQRVLGNGTTIPASPDGMSSASYAF